jgi:hypothetical protein
MATEVSKQQRQKADTAYLKMRTEHRQALAEMKIEIKPEDYANSETGLLKGPNLVNGLTLYIPEWTNKPPAGAVDTVVLYFDNGSGRWDEVGKHEFMGPIQETFPYPMTIDTNHLPDDGTCKLKFIITNYGNGETESLETTVICDRVPPYKHQPPAPLVLASDYLDDDNVKPGENLTVTLPGYEDWRVTDKVAIYLVDAACIPDDPEDASLVFFGNVPSPGIENTPVLIPADRIREFNDAECVFMYVLIDEAQNPSYVSIHKKVSLTFGPLPTTLFEPKVPQADPGPLTIKDVQLGVSVWIEKYTNWKAGDKVRVKWGGTEVQPDLDFRDTPTMEVSVQPPLLMLEEYGESTTGIKSTNVSYQVFRKGRPFGPASKNFDVNFEVPIPWLPWPPEDWPAPVHPELLEGVVKNSDGTLTNKLVRSDYGKKATFTFQWHAGAKDGDVYDCYWNGLPVVEATSTFDTASGDKPGADRTVDIPWQYIKEGQNGTHVPVHYQVHRPGVENDLPSENTYVDVNAIAVELPAASFPKIPNPTGYPGCSALEEDGALKVRIPDLTELLNNGDTISFEFIPMIGDDLSADDAPIPGVKFERNFELGSAEAPLTGFDFLVEPYSTYIKPLYDHNPDRRGRAKIHYFFDDGTEKIASDSLVTRTAFHSPNDECPITTP